MVVVLQGATPAAPQEWLQPTGGDALHFTVRSVPGALFLPYYEVQEQLFEVYPCFLP
jgi:hypothetical protein